MQERSTCKKAMRVFLSIKFWGDDRNREDVEGIIDAIESAGFDVFCFVRDAEEWGKNQFEPEEMMEITFNQISQSDFVVANVADWPIGVGVECGYAYARGVPVICICPTTKKVPNTIGGLAKYVVRYDSYNDLHNKLISLEGY